MNFYLVEPVFGLFKIELGFDKESEIDTLVVMRQ